MPQSINAINLNNNNIKELFPHSFDNCGELTAISLKSNDLRNIHDGTFDNIYNRQEEFLENMII